MDLVVYYLDTISLVPSHVTYLCFLKNYFTVHGKNIGGEKLANLANCETFIKLFAINFILEMQESIS